MIKTSQRAICMPAAICLLALSGMTRATMTQPTADIAGHSLGSIVAQTFAELWPGSTRRLILISSTGTSFGSGAAAVGYDDAPLRLFHLRTAVASSGGVFSDGFGLGIIGISLSRAPAASARR